MFLSTLDPRTPSMTELASPRATRLVAPRWLDVRLALGLLLVLVSVLAGARILAAADDYSVVYVAAHALTPGEHVTAADLTTGRVRLDGQGAFYVAAHGAAPVGYVVTRYVGTHEFVPSAALARALPTGAGDRYVTVPVATGHLPPGLGHGDLVDVYVTPKAGPGSAAAPMPTLVLAGVPVQSREGGGRGFSGSADSVLSVVLTVPAGHVIDVVRAVESGTLDLVAVPASALAGGSS
jgi:hypothetical protein